MKELNLKDSINVGVIGLGQYGYTLNAKMAMAGYPSIAFSIQPAAVEMTNNGHNFADVPDIPKNLVYLTFTDMLHATTDPAVAIRRSIVFCFVENFCEESNVSVSVGILQLAEMIGVYARPDSVLVFAVKDEAAYSCEELQAIIIQNNSLLNEKNICVSIISAEKAISVKPQKLLEEYLFKLMG